jgi:hypothetical protein
VTALASRDLNDTSRKFRRSGLTKEQVFRLWRCAIKDDNTLVDELIQHVYRDMLAFECERTERVMELIVGRNMRAGCAFRSLLDDMRRFSRVLPGQAAGFTLSGNDCASRS